jgi:hypothetical protein
MRAYYRIATSLVLVLAIRGSLALHADELALNRDALAAQESLAAAADNPPDPGEAVADVHERLRGSLDQLQSYLRASGVKVSQSWDKLLDLPGLQAELGRSDPDTALLGAVEQRLRQNHRGLELPPFLALRGALRDYRVAHEYASAERPQELYRERVAELRDCLSRVEFSFSELDHHRAGSVLGWLEPLSDEGDAAARQVRARYCRVNAVGYASGRAANLLLERKVEERNFITDMIMGSYTRGPTYTTGDVTVGVLANPAKSTLEVRLLGLVNAPATVAQRRNVTVHSSSQTALRVHKQVHFDDAGLTFIPARAGAATNVQLNDIWAPRRIVERIAWRQASRMLPSAEALASRRAEQEAGARMDQQADSMLGGVNSTYRDRIRGPLLRIDGFPQARFRSTATHARIEISQWNESQLAAATPAPAFPDKYDLACGAHESMVNNLVEVLLGGVTTRDRGWAQAVELMTGAVPRPLWVHERSVPWTATFAKERPFLATFDKDRVGFRLRLTKVSIGDNEIEHPVEISVTLIPRISEKDGPYLVREGDLQIEVAPGLDSVTESELRKFLDSKVGAVFPPELYFDGFAAPAGGTIGRLRAMRNEEFRSADGWLTLGYSIDEERLKEIRQ